MPKYSQLISYLKVDIIVLDKLAEKYNDGHYVDQDVVVDGKFISAKGLGVSFEFAFTVARYLLADNTEKVDWQAKHIYFKHWPLPYL